MTAPFARDLQLSTQQHLSISQRGRGVKAIFLQMVTVMVGRIKTISSRLRSAKGKKEPRRFIDLPFNGRFYLIAIYTVGTLIYTFKLPALESRYTGFAVCLGILSGVVGSIKVIDPKGRVNFSADTVVGGIVYLVGGLPTIIFAHLISFIIQTQTSKCKNDPWYVWLINIFK
jgi:hypothetical protein